MAEWVVVQGGGAPKSCMLRLLCFCCCRHVVSSSSSGSPLFFFGIEALVSLLIFFQLFVCISRYSTAVEIINIVVALVVCPRS